ncbi:hypothetical protein BST97_13935 [Nonlabens spongiae]|uniref:Signal transduction histidine kinase internal region domain-containing protein n=1 Tax=Nonlabens spongiae TaxID=331648 RepID=A0A1W6MN30_9FLAO|nr:histidine kinase [Nonlabens spongiae]ARN79000.1 hypothetical protein BST97_13935 [Nonlabens spongiae]
MLKKTLYFLLFTTFLVQAQEIQPYLFKLDDYVALPAKTIYSIKKDGLGNLYAATENGLLRMNDQGVELHRAAGQKGRAVFNLNVDRKGQVWMSNLAQQVLLLKKDSLSVIKSFAPQIDGGMPLISTEAGQVAVLQRENIFLIKNKEQIESYKTPDPDVLRSNLVHYNNAWYFFQGNGLYKFKNERIELIRSYSRHDKVTGGAQLFRHANQWHIMLNDEDEVKVYELGKSERHLKSFNGIKNLVITSLHAHNEEIFISTSKGLFIYRLKQDGSYDIKNVLKHRTVTDAFRDENGSLWISTYKDGIYVLPNTAIEQINLPNRADYLITNFLTKDNGLYFIVDDARLFFLDENGVFHSTEIKRRSDQKLIRINENEAFLINQDIYNLYGNKSEITASFPGVKDIIKVEQNYFIATYNKLIKTDLNFKVIKHINGRSSQIKPLIPGKIVAEFAGSLQVLNSNLGVEKVLGFNGSSITPRKFQAYSYGEEIIVLDENGQLLRAKFSNDKWNVEEFKIQGSGSIFNIRDFSIQGDLIFILTDNGLIKKSLISHQESRVDAQGTIKWSEAAELQTDSDYLFVLTSSRILKISKSIFSQKIIAPNFRTLSESYSNAEDSLKTLRIAYNSRSVQLQFVDDALFPQNRFTPLVDQKGEWIDYQKNFQKTINDLPPGNHEIKVRFQNLFTGAVASPLILPIEIETPFFLMWWFIGLSITCAAIILWLIYFLRGRFVKRKMQKELERETREKNLTQLKLENLRSQMNPHFVFNSLNSLQDYILSNNKLLASSYLVRFSRLMRMYLNHSRRAFISLRREIEALQLYLDLEKERFGDTFVYTIVIADNIDLDNAAVPSLLLQPYVENAITHGLHHKKGEKKLVVSFSRLQGSGIEIIIEDNGVGREKAKSLSNDVHHESFSMIANKNRLELMNKYHDANLKVFIHDLFDEQNLSSGTRVVINLPNINP